MLSHRPCLATLNNLLTMLPPALQPSEQEEAPPSTLSQPGEHRSTAAPEGALLPPPEQSPPTDGALPPPEQSPPADDALPQVTNANEQQQPAADSVVGLEGCDGEDEEGVHDGARAAQPGSLNQPDSMSGGEALDPDSGNSGGSGAGHPASLQQQPGSLNPDPAAGGSHPGSLNPDPGGSESQRGGTLPDSYSGCLPELRREANRIHKGGCGLGGGVWLKAEGEEVG